MNGLIRGAIAHPIGVLAIVLSMILFGVASLQTIPIQMTPDIDKPILQVRVSWPGASPKDVEQEVVLRLERELTGLSGVQSVQSDSRRGQARVTLTYGVGHDMDAALVKLLGQLARVSGLPSDAKQPEVRTSNSDDSPIARMALVAQDGVDIDIDTLGQFVDTVILEPLSRISGIAEVTSRGGAARELRIALDIDRVAEFGLSIAEVADAIRTSSAEVTAGEITEGKRSFTLRTEAISYTPDTARELVVRTDFRDGRIFNVKLSDIADIELGYKTPSSFRRLNGKPAITFAVLREPASNVVTTLERLKNEVDMLNAGVLAEQGLDLRIVYDETVYIGSALDLVQNNIMIGGILAIVVLLTFLRALAPTAIVMIAIPVSIISTFVVIAGLGLSINVISLAGLAFAVGMVVDASIVSLENIYRLKQSGFSTLKAAYWGARQVWAPILGSALTTVVVFIPILILDLPVGQLFRDIAVAISASVIVSVIVSVTVIPSLGSWLIKDVQRFDRQTRIPVIDTLARGFKHLVLSYCRIVVRSTAGGLVVVFALIAGSIATLMMMPPLDYLPDGNRNFVFGRISVPPGYTREATVNFAQSMENVARPLWENPNPEKLPHIDRFFFVAYNGGAFAGAATEDAGRIRELIPVLSESVAKAPGARAFVTQASLFGRSVGGSRGILIDVLGPDYETVEPAFQSIRRQVSELFPRKAGHQIRVRPSANAVGPELVVRPDRAALARAGVSARDFAQALDVYNDGILVREIPLGGELVELVLTTKTRETSKIEDVADIPVIARDGSLVKVGQVAEVSIESAPSQLLRKAGRRAVTIELRLHESIPMEIAIAEINEKVVSPFNINSQNGVRLALSGAADELSKAWSAMQTNVVLAIAVIYLLLVILLKSFALPLVILVTVPIAATGGILGLALLNLYMDQPLDMLTMLGFIILTGVVVNNAILMVEQTLWHIQHDAMDSVAAILEATSNRIRPIFMSTLTSLFGLLPLIIFPGAGSELYRGIGIVVFGGLLLSTVLALFFIPPLMAVLIKRHEPGPPIGDMTEEMTAPLSQTA
ncbi:MAG: efflux RND transporter permease subunit [Pseudomonadota bacterium]|nr:efflux RND transporter permease subunit [Pseudomonadota bacterium]